MASIDKEKLGEYLSAYLDDELSDAEHREVEQLIARDPQAHALLEELRQTVGLVQDLPRGTAPPSLVEDLTSAAERFQLLGDPAEAPLPRRPWWYSFRPLVSAAAALAITVGGAYWVFWKMDEEPQIGDVLAPEPAVVTKEGAVEPSVQPAKEEEEAAFADATPHAAERLGVESSLPSLGEAAHADTFVIAPGGRLPRDADLLSKDKGAPQPPASASNSLVVAGQPQIERLISSLNFEQKLDNRVSNEVLVNHDYDNEYNRVIVVVEDEEDEVLAQSQLAVHLAAYGYRDVAMIPPASSPSSQERMFLEGYASRNFDSDQQSQVMVYGPVDEIDGLVEAVSSNDSGGRRMELNIGPVVARDTVEISANILQMQRRPGSVLPRYVAADSDLEPADTEFAAADGTATSKDVLDHAHGATPPANMRTAPDDDSQPGAAGRRSTARAARRRAGDAADTKMRALGPFDRDESEDKATVPEFADLFGGIFGDAPAPSPDATGTDRPTAKPERTGESDTPGALVDGRMRRVAEVAGEDSDPPWHDRGRSAERYVTFVVQFERASPPPAARARSAPESGKPSATQPADRESSDPPTTER